MSILRPCLHLLILVLLKEKRTLRTRNAQGSWHALPPVGLPEGLFHLLPPARLLNERPRWTGVQEQLDRGGPFTWLYFPFLFCNGYSLTYNLIAGCCLSCPLGCEHPVVRQLSLSCSWYIPRACCRASCMGLMINIC